MDYWLENKWLHRVTPTVLSSGRLWAWRCLPCRGFFTASLTARLMLHVCETGSRFPPKSTPSLGSHTHALPSCHLGTKPALPFPSPAWHHVAQAVSLFRHPSPAAVSAHPFGAAAC